MKTINKFLLLLGSLAMTAGMTGCEDTRGEHLEDYASRIYFRNGGDQTISLYRIGKNTVYQVPVCKGGSDLSYTADVTVAAVEQSQLDIYNMDKGTSYRQIPQECYNFLTEPKLHFSSEDTYKVVDVELLIDKISALQEANPDLEYVLALQVYSDRQVSPNINLLVLKPKITIPSISFVEAGEHRLDLSPTSSQETTLDVDISLGIENSWDFTCTLDVHDQAWLDNYNAVRGTHYEMMPPEIYDLGDATVAFKKDSNKSRISVTVDRTNMELFKDYVIPIYLKDCSQKYEDGTDMFTLKDQVFLVHAFYSTILDQITLTDKMLSTDYTHVGDGIGIPGLVDGKDDTYWHSKWGNDKTPGDPDYGVYIDIALNEGLRVIQFRYRTRHNNGNAVPTCIRIGASNDGQNWTLIQEVQSGLALNNNEPCELPIVKVNEAYTHFRFGVARSKEGDCCTAIPASTALAELGLKGTNNL